MILYDCYMLSHAMNGKDSALLHICFKARGLTKELQDFQCESDVTDRGLEKNDHIICIKRNAVLQGSSGQGLQELFF
jgi:hypothetical protein